jgi:hypothetical protein
MAYNSPIASTTKYGVVKVGNGIDVTPEGVISVSEGVISTVLVNNAASPYTVTSSDYYIGVAGTGAAILIDLPVGTDGRTIIVKSEAGQTSNITIYPDGTETIEGGASYPLLAAADGSVTLVFRGTNWNAI